MVTRVSTNEDKLYDLVVTGGRMDTAEDDIVALDGRLDTAEADIAALEADVAGLASNVAFSALYNGDSAYRWCAGLHTFDTAALGSASITAGRMIFYPFVIGNEKTFTKLGIIVTTSQAGSTSYAAIYENTTVGGVDVPGTRVAVTAGLATTSVGLKETTGLSFTLSPGKIYWACFASSHAVGCRALTVTSTATAPMFGVDTTNAGTGGAIGSFNYIYCTLAGQPPADVSGQSFTLSSQSPQAVLAGF